MNTDKIKQSALDAMAEYLKLTDKVSTQELKECIASAISAAIKEYDRQED